jgi:alpha/beta superfamily hydrolase
MAFRLPRGARLVRFPSADGLQLEGRLTAGSRDQGVVLCHPHPLYGGSMLTPVILTVETVFRTAGFTTLAFNFRGVGASQGTHGEGRTEVADVAGETLAASLPERPWLRVLDTDHFFAGSLDDLAVACGTAIAWAAA